MKFALANKVDHPNEQDAAESSEGGQEAHQWTKSNRNRGHEEILKAGLESFLAELREDSDSLFAVLHNFPKTGVSECDVLRQPGGIPPL
jgi:hypothetical protein